jgi:hypothetical protein
MRDAVLTVGQFPAGLHSFLKIKSGNETTYFACKYNKKFWEELMTNPKMLQSI